MTLLRQWAAGIHRLFAVFVLLLVLLFPAWKGLLLGYVPVAVGLLFAGVLWRTMHGTSGLIEAWSPGRLAVVLYILPTALQVGLLLFLRPEPMYDGQFVFAEAAELARTGGMSQLTYYPPLQAWWYAGWFKLFGATPLVAQLSHVPLSALVTWLTWCLARASGSRHAGLAAVLVAYYPSFLAYVLVTPYYHYLYTAAVLATAWGWVASSKHPPAALAAGLASGLGSLAKATQLIAPAQALLFWLLSPRSADPAASRRLPIASFVLFLVGMALAVAPWAARNYRVFDAFVPVCTSGGLVLYSANNPESNGLYSGLPDTAEIESPQAMLAHSRESAHMAKQFIREEPLAFLRLAWIKVLHTWGGEATFAELINRAGAPMGRWEDLFSVVFFAGWVCVVGLWAAWSLASLRRRVPPTAIELACAVVVLSNAVVYAVFEGGDRHHLPLVPLLVICSLGGAVPRTGLATATPRA